METQLVLYAALGFINLKQTAGIAMEAASLLNVAKSSRTGVNMIYFDNAATKKPTEDTVNTFRYVAKNLFSNPSSDHAFGLTCKGILDQSREICAETLGCSVSNIYFTSCASESNSQIVESAVSYGIKERKNHIVTTAIEHPSVLKHMENLENRGYDVSYARPNTNGNVPAEHVISLIRADTFFVSVMLVNNETGAIQDVEKIAEYCDGKGILFHTDATQGVGMEQTYNLEYSKIHFMSMSGHKMGAGHGAGLLYASNKAKRMLSGELTPIIFGNQERGARGGTYNLAPIFSMAKELRMSTFNYERDKMKISSLENALIEKLRAILPVKLNCKENRKPGILSICFPGLPASSLQCALGNDDIYVSSGSACKGHRNETSHVLKAMGVSKTDAECTLRFSLSSSNTFDELDIVACSLANYYIKFVELAQIP